MRPAPPILVKRYVASRLYDTTNARYLSVDELCVWTVRGIAFEVRKAETGEDVSRLLLAE